MSANLTVQPSSAEAMDMKRLIVIGCPGSGKSELSRKLHKITGIPLYHLDMMYWNADRTTVQSSIFLKRLGAALEGDEWIVDGNYLSTMDLRLSACDTVIFLDYPTEVCLDGIRGRRGKPRSDMPWIEYEQDEDFIQFIESFREQQRPAILDLLEKHSDKNIIVFKSREEADAFFSPSAEA